MTLRDLLALALQRSWLAVAGLITVVLVPTTLEPSEQGLFFTLLGVAALQSVFEAGVTVVFMNQFAHHRARFESGDFGGNGDVARLLVAAQKWFLGLAIIFGLSVGVGGYIFLKDSLDGIFDRQHWAPPFAIIVSSVALSLSNLGRVSLLEGWGRLGDVAKARLLSNILSAAVMWVGLISSLGVWSLALSYSVQALLLVSLTRRLARSLPVGWQNESSLSKSELNWRRDIAPIQFKLGISYMCGYLVSQGVVPYTLRLHGAVEAGRVGFAVSIFGAAATVLASYIYLSGPRYADLIVVHDWTGLLRRYWQITSLSVLAGMVGFGGLVAAMVEASEHIAFLAPRLPSPTVGLALAVNGVVALYVGSTATMTRAFRSEPILPISILSALAYVLVGALCRERSVDLVFTWLAITQVALVVPTTWWVSRKFLSDRTRR